MATNPPIAIGELVDVPAPGSGVKSAWSQEVTNRIVHRFATAAARDAQWPAATAGRGAVCVTLDTDTPWQVALRAAVPTWVPFGSTPWVAPTFTNGWSDYAGGNQTARYRKIGDIVYIEGMIKGGTVGTSAFTLPVGYRPLLKQQFPGMAGAAFAVIVIDPAGTFVEAVGSVANCAINVSFSTL